MENFPSWFQFQTQTNLIRSPRTLHELDEYPHIKTWLNDTVKHQQKCAVFDGKEERARTISNYRATTNILKVNAEEQESDIETAKHELKTLEKEDNLMIRRTRKYRLYPTPEQRKRLR